MNEAIEDAILKTEAIKEAQKIIEEYIKKCNELTKENNGAS